MEGIKDPLPHLKSLAECINKVVKDGYTHNFKAQEGEKLLCLETEEVFSPDQVKIVNFFRFEGMSDPEDNSILYVMETSTGVKGTLVDAYGAYSDMDADNFIKTVENMSKKNASAPV